MKSEKNPDGFDYEAGLKVLAEFNASNARWGNVSVKGGLPGHRSGAHDEHLFAGSQCFVHSRPRLQQRSSMAGAGGNENAEAWLGALAEIKASYARSGVMIYPGHGTAGGIELVDRIRIYLTDFLAAAGASATNAAMTERVVGLYPGASKPSSNRSANIAVATSSRSRSDAGIIPGAFWRIRRT